ncbi:hypothetical protein JCM10212_002770 [Sporobolomyces blumeae]
MSSSPPAKTHERLEVPTLPPTSSRFVLPPPPSDLLNRLQAFLPQIRDANAQLEDTPREQGDEVEEAVVMEELSSDSDDSSDVSSSDDEDSSSEEEGQDGMEQDEPEATPQEQGSLAHLLDISARPSNPSSKKVVVVEEIDAEPVVEGAEEGER